MTIIKLGELMIFGYVFGCLASIILWGLDRQNIISYINYIFKKCFKSKLLIQIVEVILIILICYGFSLLKNRNISNFLTAFIVIDISNAERKNLKKREKVKFYDSISLLSKAIVCGFIAPLMYILLFNNLWAIFYMLLYNFAINKRYIFLDIIFSAMNIFPALVADGVLYVIYIVKNKTVDVDFKGDFIVNMFIRPLLNVDVLAAYVESVNFYYHYKDGDTDYLKSYGEYSNKIDDACIKDYLCVVYSICIFCFVLFYVLKSIQCL